MYESSIESTIFENTELNQYNYTKCTAKCDAFVVFSVVMLEATLVGGSSGDKNLPTMYTDTTRSLEFERDHFLIIHVAIYYQSYPLIAILEQFFTGYGT